MPRHLCIHGHFYQPPREDPWLGDILPEDSAAPEPDWNQRITRESYAPLAFARRLDDAGRIADILNCYEWMSFNVGPTLLNWLRRAEPHTYDRMIEADRTSLARWGHGNAMAQVYHHSILPLATARDKRLEIFWARSDFRNHFGRDPEGMWLAECAADVDTLEALAEQGIRFTILSPHQVASVAEKGTENWQHVSGADVPIGVPYDVELPSGNTIAVFFYNAPISQAVAFEQLLDNGETFWKKLSSAAGDGLLTVCTDGETYGHHFTFGEMALAYVLGQTLSGRDDMRLTNYATYLSTHPPTHKVRIISPSAWSCAHGVERWRSDCGCTDGGHPDWSQQWRGPLREALNELRDTVNVYYHERGAKLFHNADMALESYADTLSGGQTRDAYMAQHLLPDLDTAAQHTAWQLLTMQEQMLAAFASCAWFFDELTRIEPINAMTYALRAIDLLEAAGYPDIPAVQERFLTQLEAARSNIPKEGNGRDVFMRHVMPRKESNASLILQAMLRLWAEKRLPCPNIRNTVQWRNVAVSILPTDVVSGSLSGEARIRWHDGPEGPPVQWEWTPPQAGRIRNTHITLSRADGTSTVFTYEDLPRNKRQAIAMRSMEVAHTQRLAAFEEDAANAVALFEPWTEAQNDQPLGYHWKAVSPALAIAYMKHPGLSEAQRNQIARYLTTTGLLKDGGRELINNWLNGRLLRFLEGPDEHLERATQFVERARTLLPHPDLWRVQNALWHKGANTPAARRFAEAIGLRMR